MFFFFFFLGRRVLLLLKAARLKTNEPRHILFSLCEATFSLEGSRLNRSIKWRTRWGSNLSCQWISGIRAMWKTKKTKIGKVQMFSQTAPRSCKNGARILWPSFFGSRGLVAHFVVRMRSVSNHFGNQHWLRHWGVSHHRYTFQTHFLLITFFLPSTSTLEFVSGRKKKLICLRTNNASSLEAHFHQTKAATSYFNYENDAIYSSFLIKRLWKRNTTKTRLQTNSIPSMIARGAFIRTLPTYTARRVNSSLRPLSAKLHLMDRKSRNYYDDASPEYVAVHCHWAAVTHSSVWWAFSL